jgi:tetratricopeptide (TPR) repeat protein
VETEYFEKTPRKANRWFRAFVVLALLYGITFSLHSIFNWIFFLGSAYSLFMSYFTLPVQPRIFQKQGKPFNTAGRAPYGSPVSQPDRARKIVWVTTMSIVGFFVFLIIVGVFNSNDPEEQTPESTDSEATDDTPTSLTNTGLDLYRAEKFDESEGYFDRALALDPAYMEAVYGKGIVLYQRGDRDEANTYLAHAYEGGYQHPWLSWELADTFEKNGNTQRAVELYKESVGLDSSYVDCYNRLAELVPAERDKYLELARKHAND